jgi:DNA-binding transcriptional LysR family regulator
MRIDQIRYFLAICDKCNFTRAAQTCGIKQSSLTAAIQRLERSIGGKLFDRSSSPIRLTKLGSQLLPIWKEIDVLFEKTVALANAHFVQRETDHLGRVLGKGNVGAGIYRPQSNPSASRLAAGEAGFLHLIQSSVRPDR